MINNPFHDATLFHGENGFTQRYRVKHFIDSPEISPPYLIVVNGNPFRDEHIDLTDCEDDRIQLPGGGQRKRVRDVVRRFREGKNY